jgi:ABC transporter, phosphonate, periplasmic substrate-binding protein
MPRIAPGFASILLAVAAGVGADDALTLVACAPGYPGSTVEAQPVMDGFADAVAEAAGWVRGRVKAEYHEDEAHGLERMAQADAGVALVPLPFFLKHEARLRLVAQAQAVAEGGRAEEVWALVAGKGKLKQASALGGWEIVSSAAYAPGFVRGAVLGAWGVVPGGARLVASGAVLSGLRRASAGEKIALVLDSAETAALESLPFAKELQIVTRSAAMPATVVCSVAGRVAPARVAELRKALLALAHRPSGAAALGAMRIESFSPVDAESLRRARAAYLAAKDPS